MIVRLAKKPINAKPLSSKHEQYNLFVISSNPETHPGGKKVSKILTLFKTNNHFLFHVYAPQMTER